MNDIKRVLIIGAGITGLSVALKLSKQRIPVEIIEKESIVGGLGRSVRKGPHVMDIGPHSFFTENETIHEILNDLFGDDLKLIKREVKLFFKDRFLDYPLSARSVLFQMGIKTSVLSALSFMKSYFKSLRNRNDDEPENIEAWAIQNFGYYLCKIFFKPYTEQFWKMPARELSSRVIPSSTKMSLISTLKHILIKQYFYLTKKEPGTMTLVEREALPTYYPVSGFGDIAEKLKDLIEKRGGKVHVGWAVEEIKVLPDGSFTLTAKNSDARERFDGDVLVSTIPLNRFIPMLQPISDSQILAHAGKLHYLSLIVIYLVTERRNVLGCQYSYFLNRPYNRVSEMNLFSEKLSPDGQNLLSLEITCHSDSPEWRYSDEKLYEWCIPHLEEDGIIHRKDVKAFYVLKDPSVYPVYQRDYEKHLSYVNAYINRHKNLYSTGRQGQFFYGDIDQMMEMGFETGEKILATIRSEA